MKRIAIVFFLALSIGAYCQQLPTRCEVSLPDYILKMQGNPSGIGADQSWQEWCEARIRKGDFGNKNTKTVWTVYSDRTDNKAYSSPNASASVSATLGFRDKLYVAKMESGYALVYSDTEIQDNFPKINKTAVCKGWVPISNLLLWEECPMTQNRIFQKALVVHDISQSHTAEMNPHFLLSPAANTSQSNLQAKNLDILFVMKKVQANGTVYYLLAKEVNIGRRVTQTLYGWLPRTYVTEWNQRLVLEPSYASENIHFYKNKEISPTIFPDEKTACSAYTYENFSTPILVYDWSTKRLDAYRMRNPIISGTTTCGDHVFKVATIASGGNKDFESAADRDRKIEQLKKKIDNINIILVIDATNSMKAYYLSVVKALSEVLEHDYMSTIKVGCVLYKDYKDHADGLLYQPMTQDINKVAGFISTHQPTSNIESDEDEYEAVFDGLNLALDDKKLKYEKDQSNFIILIGEAANHRKTNQNQTWQEASDAIAKKMANNNINFLAYQINNTGSMACSDFAKQINYIQKGLVDHYKTRKVIEEDVEYKLTGRQLRTIVRSSNNDVSLPFFVANKYAASGSSETTQGLKEIITENVSDFEGWVNDQMTLFDGAVTAGSVNMTQLREMLRKHNWSDAEISGYVAYMKKGGVTKLIGAAPEQISGTDKKLFEYALFFSRNELNDLVKELKKVKSASSRSDRKEYQDAMITLGLAMTGLMNREDIGKMKMDDLLSQIYGVPVKIQSCGVQIDQIVSMKASQLESIVLEFKDKVQGLERILNQGNYDGAFQSNGNTYYWIPFSAMPGFCTNQ